MITFSELSTEQILQVREKKCSPEDFTMIIKSVNEEMKTMTFESHEEKRKYFGDEIVRRVDKKNLENTE